MGTNFDEKKAFEDLSAILNYMYNFANYYYDEMKTAQKLCDEKDRNLNNAKKQYAAERDNAEKNFNYTVQAKDKKISELESRIFDQEQSFKSHLKEYGDYNMKLTKQLEDLRANLADREAQLRRREDEFKTKSYTLTEERENLKKEREEFEKSRTAQKEKFSNYERMEQTIQSFDEDRRELNKKIKDLEKALETKDDEWQKQLKYVTDENYQLKNQVKNLKAQLAEDTSAGQNDHTDEHYNENRDDGYNNNSHNNSYKGDVDI